MSSYNELQDLETLEERAAVVLAEAWRLLPPIKHDLRITGIGIEDLDMKHGSWSPDERRLMFSTRLFMGENESQLMYMDINGWTPPQQTPYTTRALHTAIHELGHAIGTLTGADQAQEWLSISGWVERGDDPVGTQRYHEGRPGWGGYISEWRHRANCWWCRDYSRRSPFEDFADCVAHTALGWFDFITHPMGQEKLRYIRREVWGEKGKQGLDASVARWRTLFAKALNGKEEKRKRKPVAPWILAYEQELIDAIKLYNDEELDDFLDSVDTFHGPLEWVDDVLHTREAKKRFVISIMSILMTLSEEAWVSAGGNAEVWESTQVRNVLAYAEKVASSYVDTTATRLREALLAHPEATTVPQIEALIREVLAKNNTVRAPQVAATESQRITEAAHAAVAASEGKTLTWRTADDDAVCEFCQTMEGQTVQAGEVFAHEGETITGVKGGKREVTYDDLRHPPLHPLCVTGDTLITSGGRISAVSERWYDGEMLIITTAGQKKLSCTPNHPILTRNGWVSAGILKKGDDILCCADEQGIIHSDQNVQNMPSTIHEIAKTFRLSSSMASREVPMTAEAFHGDGMGSKVAIIWSDNLLRNGNNSTLNEHLFQDNFRMGSFVGMLSCDSCFALLVKSFCSSNSSLVGLLDLPNSLFNSHFLPFYQCGFSSSSQSHPPVNQTIINDSPRNSEHFSQSVCRHPIGIHSDNIVNIQRYAFHGFVYNLQTELSWYIGNGIITHNCRCVLE